MSEPNSILTWQHISSGPLVAFAAGSIMGNSYYLHGGVQRPRSTMPLSSLYRLDLNTMEWHELTTSGSPALSHHACVPYSDTCLMFIGIVDALAYMRYY